MADIRVCPGCGTDVTVHNTIEEDRRLVECPEHGYVEVVFHEIGDIEGTIVERALEADV